MSTRSRLRVEGDLQVPGDKSISHRALLLAAVASGESRLRRVLPGADCRSTAAVLRGLGVPVPDPPPDGGELRIRGAGIDAWHAPAGPLDCGNSGTTARLLLGLVASRRFAAVVTGDASLRRRPMGRVTEPLTTMGASFRPLAKAGRLPIEVRGSPLRGLHHRSAQASAQVKSAVLLAGLGGGVAVAITEPRRSRDHTERLLAGLGVPVRSTGGADGWLVELEPPDRPLPPLELEVPGDPSSAAFLAALALLADEGELRIRGVCLNPTRAGFVPVLARMGARIRVEAIRDEHGEPVGDLVVTPAQLRPTRIEPAEVPGLVDEIPVLAALAARAAGTTVITGAEELRVKESDRIAALVSNLRALGVQAEELPDGLRIDGSDRPLHGRVETHGDHRIAMAFGVLAALLGSRIEIDDRACAEVSFPGFWDLLERIRK